MRGNRDVIPVNNEHHLHVTSSGTSIASPQASSGRPSSSSMSNSSSFVSECKKCQRCGKKFSRNLPNRQHAVELADGEDHSSPFDAPHAAVPSVKPSLLRQLQTTGDDEAHPSPRNLKGGLVHRIYCDKCMDRSSQNSSFDSSLESPSGQNLRSTVNVFTFIRATFNRILESKFNNNNNTNGNSVSKTATSASNHRKSALRQARVCNADVEDGDRNKHSGQAGPCHGCYVNPLGCSEDSTTSEVRIHSYQCPEHTTQSTEKPRNPFRAPSGHVVFHPEVVAMPRGNNPANKKIPVCPSGWPGLQGSLENVEDDLPVGQLAPSNNYHHPRSANSPMSSDTTPNEFIASENRTDQFLLNLPNYEPTSGPYFVAHTQVDLEMIYRRNPRFPEAAQTNQHHYQRAARQAFMCAAYSCPAQSRSMTAGTCNSSTTPLPHLLCATWPLLGRRVFMPDLLIEDETNDENDGRELRRCSTTDFHIPFDDIKLTELIHSGRTKDIYRGQWHGDVSVHVYHLEQMETRKFWREVTRLTTVRHENIELFMGAAFEPPRCCIVTSLPERTTLHSLLHGNCPGNTHTDLPSPQELPFRLHVMRELVKALGYLHARRQRPILVGRLTSRSVFIEGKEKVVLTLLDYNNYTENDCEETGEICLPTEFLPYAAPELLWESSEQEPKMVLESRFTTATDVFAFGTIVYELVANEYPLSHLSPRELVLAIMYGQRGDFSSLKISDFLKSLIRECWSQDALSRPEFRAICECLVHGQFTHKRHSSSVPDNLHRNNSLFSRCHFD